VAAEVDPCSPWSYATVTLFVWTMPWQSFRWYVPLSRPEDVGVDCLSGLTMFSSLSSLACIVQPYWSTFFFGLLCSSRVSACCALCLLKSSYWRLLLELFLDLQMLRPLAFSRSGWRSGMQAAMMMRLPSTL
jgi:hypothetical protein